jgi:hypothetical protein
MSSRKVGIVSLVSGVGPVEAPGQARADSGRGFEWADILWREWRQSEDEEYAEHLFDLTANMPLSWPGVAMVVLCSTLYGLSAGYLLGLIALNFNAGPDNWVLSGMLPLLLAWLVGIGAGIVGAVVSGWLSWRVGLGLATPQVFGNRIGGLGRFNLAVAIGLIAGLAGISLFIVGLILVIFTGLGFRLGVKLAARDWGMIWLMGGAAGLGVFLSQMIVQGPWLGLAVGLGLGIWLGLTWGSAPLGIIISWLGLLAGLLIIGPADWLTSWLGLSAGFGLGLLPVLVGNGLEAAEAYPYRSWYFWWRRQPTLAEVRQALQAALAEQPKLQELWREPLRCLAQLEPGRDSVGVWVDDLKRSDWVGRLAARQALIELGGEAAEALAKLNDGPLQEVAVWLLGSIEQETRRQFARRASLIRCPDCLARFGPRSVNFSLGISFSYYGCRICGQSREFLECPVGAVAVLDTNWTELQSYQDSLLRINWLLSRKVFDFDRVEIVQATDEQVERLAVQVGNDTDPARRSGYGQMACRVGPACRLSENTWRILRRTFGRVVVVVCE